VRAKSPKLWVSKPVSADSVRGTLRRYGKKEMNTCLRLVRLIRSVRMLVIIVLKAADYGRFLESCRFLGRVLRFLSNMSLCRPKVSPKPLQPKW